MTDRITAAEAAAVELPTEVGAVFWGRTNAVRIDRRFKVLEGYGRRDGIVYVADDGSAYSARLARLCGLRVVPTPGGAR